MLNSVGTPSKSKLNDNWSSGWWDFYPLIERPRLPIEWSNSSVIFTSHAVQPVILARHFSSSKQFILSSPNPISSKPSSYHPATIITASPDDEWLFAYFPGKDMDGVACLWRRGLEVDKWTVHEFWTYSAQSGVVSVDWLGLPRERHPHPVTGMPARSPHRGPKTLLSSPNLVLVTQDHRVTLCYMRNYMPTLKMLSCSLLKPDQAVENAPRQFTDSQTDVGSVRMCINASIGIPYNDSSFIIAMRSQVFPSNTSPPNHNQFSSMDLSMPMETEVQSDPLLDMKEDCTEESSIELCEIQLKLDGVTMRLSAEPLPPIQGNPAKLRDMYFICNSASGLPKSTPSTYIVASFLDFTDYNSLPKSSLKCYSLSKEQLPTKKSWKYRQEAFKSFDNRIAGFIVPFKQIGSHLGVLVGFYDTSGTHKRKSKRFSIGNTRRLKIPDLNDDEQWSHLSLVFPGHKSGRDIPTNVCFSPNDALLCTISPSLWSAETTIHKAPERLAPFTPSDGVTIPSLSSKFASAIVSRRSTDDLTHTISMQTFPINDAIDILHQTFLVLDRCGGVSWLAQVGLSLEFYRSRAHHTKSELERKRFTDKWQTVHDICSVAACSVILEEAKVANEFMVDTETVWQLIDLIGWMATLLEKLMKECVLSSEFSDATGSSALDTSKTKALDAPILLHLVHPTAFKALRATVSNIKRFRQTIDKLTPKSENTQIAKEALIDILDCAGLDVSGLEQLLDDFSQTIKDIDENDARRSLAICQPTLTMQSKLKGFVRSVADSQILRKARLFIKPSELIDGAPQPMNKKEKIRDVVLKGVVLHRVPSMSCLRCGGRSELGKEPGVRFRVWDKMWSRRCICAGEWSTAVV
ncbi:hypothetical protein K435DRAFT_842205 [Dendrothele bispora CBS 962.96]|uniref:Mediator complex subunit 16 n=1 Tax=Dendrothele bispora (strain CBS 962.96) TaxID=1314807 RepID=A0A4S8LHK3_DENBC|nr:hypothetical protein K435DRAFT_842205 [Dendrothele bispora CBS 962.96]